MAESKKPQKYLFLSTGNKSFANFIIFCLIFSFLYAHLYIRYLNIISINLIGAKAKLNRSE